MKRLFATLMILIMMIAAVACTATGNLEHSGVNGKWTVKLSDQLGKGEKSVEGNTTKTTYKGESGFDLFIIEVESPDYQASEARLEEETTAVDELEPTRVEVLDIANFGKVYGSVVKDHTMENMIYYYMANVDNDVVYLMFTLSEKDYSERIESEVKGIVTTLTLK